MSSEIYSNLARGTFHQDVVLDMGVILCDSYLRTYTYGIYYVMLTKRINLIIFILSIILIYFCTRENVLKYTSTLKLHVTENVERAEEQSEAESQVISQTKIGYTEAGFKTLSDTGSIFPVPETMIHRIHSHYNFKNLKRGYSMVNCIHFLGQVT